MLLQFSVEWKKWVCDWLLGCETVYNKWCIWHFLWTSYSCLRVNLIIYEY